MLLLSCESPVWHSVGWSVWHWDGLTFCGMVCLILWWAVWDRDYLSNTVGWSVSDTMGCSNICCHCPVTVLSDTLWDGLSDTGRVCLTLWDGLMLCGMVCLILCRVVCLIPCGMVCLTLWDGLSDTMMVCLILEWSDTLWDGLSDTVAWPVWHCWMVCLTLCGMICLTLCGMACLILCEMVCLILCEKVCLILCEMVCLPLWCSVWHWNGLALCGMVWHSVAYLTLWHGLSDTVGWPVWHCGMACLTLCGMACLTLSWSVWYSVRWPIWHSVGWSDTCYCCHVRTLCANQRDDAPTHQPYNINRYVINISLNIANIDLDQRKTILYLAVTMPMGHSEEYI